MSTGDSLFCPVVHGNPIGIVHLVVKELLSVLASMNGAEVIRTPHLIGVELIGTSVFVAVRLAVNAVEEFVTGLEAQLLVEHDLLGVSHSENFNFRNVRHCYRTI
jgi:hypothetical protein